MKNELLLLAGSDIPFIEARLTIHQPTLKEIGYIGEEVFFIGCGFLNFSKNLLEASDKIKLANYSDFDIFMSMMINKDKAVKKNVDSAYQVLSLIFPQYQITAEVRNNCGVLILKKDNENYEINNNNFSAFKKILSTMFSLDLTKGEEQYNPAGDLSQKIMKKLQKRHEQLSKFKENSFKNNGKIAILSRYASILAIGLQKNLNDLMKYTVYQLYNEFQRFQLKVQWDAYVSAKMAGAKDLEETDNWMIDLDEQDKNKNKIK